MTDSGKFFSTIAKHYESRPEYIFTIVASLLSLGLTAFIFAIAFLRRVIFGLRMCLQGLIGLQNSMTPAGVPADFEDIDTVAGRIIERNLITTNLNIAAFKDRFGINAHHVSPLHLDIAKHYADDLFHKKARRVLLALSTSLIVLGVFWVLAEYDPGRTGSARQAGGAVTALLSPGAAWFLASPFLIITSYLMLSAWLELTLIKLLIPKEAPIVECHSRSEQLSADSSPQQLFNQLPDNLDALAWDDFPNRIYQKFSERPAVSVSDTGEFHGRIIVEQQPRPIASLGHRAGKFWLICSWANLLASTIIAMFLLLPGPVRSALGTSQLPVLSMIWSPLIVLIMAGISRHLWSRGRRMHEEARRLFDGHRFDSTLAIIDLTGSVGRADLQMGQRDDDAFSSSVVGTKSTFVTQIWAARIISETPHIEKKRFVAGTLRSQESLQWIDHILNSARSLCSRRMEPAGINLGSESVQEFVDANNQVSRFREQAKAQGQLEGRANFHGAGSPQLPEAARPLPIPGPPVVDHQADEDEREH